MRYLLAALAALLIAPAAAHARPAMTDTIADTAALTELTSTAADLNEEPENPATPSTFELDPCETVGRRAVCEYTFTYSYGDTCDGEAIVRYSRRGRLVVSLQEYYCDSDDTGVLYGNDDE